MKNDVKHFSGDNADEQRSCVVNAAVHEPDKTIEVLDDIVTPVQSDAPIVCQAALSQFRLR